jgi:Helix-turn-helix domain
VITAVVVEGRPVAEVAIAYGVSRQWIYKLLTRYRGEGEAAFEPRSPRPYSQHRRSRAATVELIIGLEAAAAAARCSITLLLRRPSVNPLSKSAFGRSSTFRPQREAATTGMAIQHEPC